MSKKTLRKNKYSKNTIHWSIFLIFLPLFLVIFVLGGGFIFYQSRTIPDLGEENQETVLPIEFQHILGAKTGVGLQRELQIRIPIFIYHYVEYVSNDPGRQKLNIEPNILIAQIETLKGAGYTFITQDDLATAFLEKKKLPKKPAILNFDDGYIDFYTDVFPILQKENVKAVAYVVPNFLDRPNYMFTFQLKEVAKSPLVEIGAHTMDHYALAGMNTKEAIYEIVQSRKVLQEMLHLPINSFAYPYGSFDRAAVQIVKRAGFTNAVSVVPGIVQTQENEYFLFRLRPGDRSGQALLDYLKQDTFQPW